MSERRFGGGGEGGGKARMVAVEKWEGSGEAVSRSIAAGLLEVGGKKRERYC